MCRGCRRYYMALENAAALRPAAAIIAGDENEPPKLMTKPYRKKNVFYERLRAAVCVCRAACGGEIDVSGRCAAFFSHVYAINGVSDVEIWPIICNK